VGGEWAVERGAGYSAGSNGAVRPEKTALPNRWGVWKDGVAVSARDHWLYCGLV